MHHLNSEEISTFHAWETATGLPITRIKDVYHAFVEPHLRDASVRQDWDNQAEEVLYFREDPSGGGRTFSDDQKGRRPSLDGMSATEKKAHENFEACGQVCAENERCLSYRWQDGLCSISESFRMGHPVRKSKQERRRFMSGWNMEHIEAMVEQNGECGGSEVLFPEV